MASSDWSIAVSCPTLIACGHFTDRLDHVQQRRISSSGHGNGLLSTIVQGCGAAHCWSALGGVSGMPTSAAGEGQPAPGWGGRPLCGHSRSLGSASGPRSDVPVTGLHPDAAPRPNFSRSPAERPKIGRRASGAAESSSRTFTCKTITLGSDRRIVSRLAHSLLQYLDERRGRCRSTRLRPTLLARRASTRRDCTD
jgi:hypothetical protein